MRPPLVISTLFALVVLALTACGTMALPPETATQLPHPPRAGAWSLEYSGGCTGQEAETLQITVLDETAIAFDDFTLRRNEDGEYVGSAIFIAPMPVDGRDIPYEIAYALSAADAGGFTGTETIVEGGGHGIACPVKLRYLGED